MAETIPQSYAHHTRWDPAFHFFVLPVFLISWIVSVVLLVRHFSLLAGWGVVLATAAAVAVVKIRTNALKVQDRVIRLEERLRLAKLLPEAAQPQIEKLSEAQLVGLRFAGDEEVRALVQRTLTENLAPAEIKKSVKSWRPDYWRV
jgi:Family of unknown function (DUF6526)